MNTITQPKTFAQLKKMMQTINQFEGSLRLPKDQKLYETAITESIKMQITIDSIKKLVNEKGSTVTDNDFPYTLLLEFLPNVQHRLFWFNGNETEVKKFVSKLKKEKLDYCFFQNLPTKQSVPEIAHYHFFITPRN